MKRLTIFGICLFIIIALGFFVRFHKDNKDQNRSMVQVKEAPSDSDDDMLEPLPERDVVVKSTAPSMSEEELKEADYLAGKERTVEELFRMIDLFRKWASIDPEAALNYVNNMWDREMAEALIEDVFHGMGRGDPFAALYMVEATVAKYPNLTSADLFSDILLGMADVKDYSRMKEWLALFPVDQDKEDLLIGVTDQWAKDDPLSFADTLLEMEPSHDRAMLLGRMTLVWAQSDPLAAATFAEQLPAGEDRKYAIQNTISEWIKRDIDEVADWLNQLDPDDDVDFAVAKFSTTVDISLYEPTTIMDWANSIADPELRKSSIAKVLDNWVSVEPLTALEWAISSDYDDEIVSQTIENLIETDFDTGLDVLNQLDHDGLMDTTNLISGALSSQINAGKIDRVIEALDRDSIDEGIREAFYRSHIAEMVKINPEQTSEAVLALSESEEKTDLISSLVKEWAVNDPQGAIDFANQLEDTEWAGSDRGESLRLNSIQDAYMKWAESDKDSALVDLDNNMNLTSEERALIKATIDF